MENNSQTQTTNSPVLITARLNQNVNVISNAIDLATAVVVSIDSDLIADQTDGQDVNLDLVRAAVAARVQNNLGIKD